MRGVGAFLLICFIDDRRAQPFGQRKPMILTEYPPRRQRRRTRNRPATARDWQLGQRLKY